MSLQQGGPYEQRFAKMVETIQSAVGRLLRTDKALQALMNDPLTYTFVNDRIAELLCDSINLEREAVNKQLIDELTAGHRRIDTLQQTVTDLQQQLAGSKATAGDQLEMLSRENSRLKGDLAHCEEQYSSAQRACTELTAELASKKRAIDELNEFAVQQQEDAKRSDAAHKDELDARLRDAEQRRQQSEHEATRRSSEAEGRLRSAEAVIDQLRSQLDQATHAISQNSSAAQEQISQQAQKLHAAESLRREIAALKQQLEEETRAHSAARHQWEEERERLAQSLAQADQQKLEAQTACDRLSEQVAHLLRTEDEQTSSSIAKSRSKQRQLKSLVEEERLARKSERAAFKQAREQYETHIRQLERDLQGSRESVEKLQHLALGHADAAVDQVFAQWKQHAENLRNEVEEERQAHRNTDTKWQEKFSAAERGWQLHYSNLEQQSFVMERENTELQKACEQVLTSAHLKMRAEVALSRTLSETEQTRAEVLARDRKMLQSELEEIRTAEQAQRQSQFEAIAAAHSFDASRVPPSPPRSTALGAMPASSYDLRNVSAMSQPHFDLDSSSVLRSTAGNNVSSVRSSEWSERRAASAAATSLGHPRLGGMSGVGVNQSHHQTPAAASFAAAPVSAGPTPSLSRISQSPPRSHPARPHATPAVSNAARFGGLSGAGIGSAARSSDQNNRLRRSLGLAEQF